MYSPFVQDPNILFFYVLTQVQLPYDKIEKRICLISSYKVTLIYKYSMVVNWIESIWNLEGWVLNVALFSYV